MHVKMEFLFLHLYEYPYEDVIRNLLHRILLYDLHNHDNVYQNVYDYFTSPTNVTSSLTCEQGAEHGTTKENKKSHLPKHL